MADFKIIDPDFSVTPTSGTSRLTVEFTDATIVYDKIVQTGSTTDKIIQTGNSTNKIIQTGV